MDIRKLQRAIVDGLEDVKAQDIVVFNTEALSPLFERVIIASGTSNRQTKALASSVRDSVKSRGMEVMRTEGEDNGEWIIVDCGAAVAHIMQPSIREYYHLEEIWGGKPVKMKIGGSAPAGLPKASEPDDEPVPVAKKTARKAAPSKAASGQAPAAKKAAAKAPARAAAKTASRPAAPDAKRAAAGKRTSSARGKPAPEPRAVKTLVVGKTVAAKKAPARKSASGAARKPR